MFFFNLSLLEFLGAFAAVSGVVVALYLLDRSKQRHTVATFRFWNPAQMPTEQRQRKRIQQPWSLLLQLISLLLLLLAIAQLRWGSAETGARDHVLVLDTSAWMAARSVNGPYMDQARVAALAWLNALPAADRVMVIRADAAASPATSFESKREVVRKAITESRPGASALRLEPALRLAESVQRNHATRAGEIVFAGAGRIPETDNFTALPVAANRVRLLPVRGRVENVGIRRIGVRRSRRDVEYWDVLVSVRNDSSKPKLVPLEVRYGGAAAAVRQLTLAPGTEQQVAFEYRTKSGGLFEARILLDDGFPADNRAILDLPADRQLLVTVFSNEPSLMAPVFSANPRLRVEYKTPAQYAAPSEGVVVLDRFLPPTPLALPSIQIEAKGKSAVTQAKLTRWHNETNLGLGLRSRDTVLDTAQVYALAPGDIPIAEVAAGPVMLARPGAAKTVLLGFQPLRSSLRYELATPLLFANALHWLAPESFLRWELQASSVGTVSATVDENSANEIRVRDEQGQALPFTREGSTVRFFAGSPGTVKLTDGQRESVYSLTLPEPGETDFTWPTGIRRGVPRANSFGASSRELWYGLAILGALGLLLEWLFFGLGRRALPSLRTAPASVPLRKAS
ncbi:MAG: VWA domain-containing protein [Bryobacteraceae bacterium]|nr:VWA domain-containing protein [Bryobacteraceae bacterium]